MVSSGHGPTSTPHRHASWLSALFVALLLLAMLVPLISSNAGAAPAERANVRFEADLPAPIVDLATSADGQHVVAGDTEGRFTMIPAAGSDERTWQAPMGGMLETIEPTTIGAAVDEPGDHWAAAVAYGSDTEGAVYGFARWSDNPIWTFQLPDEGTLAEGDQPQVFVQGGGYYVLGTAQGKVYLLRPHDDTGPDKKYARRFTEDNDGRPFGTVSAIDIDSSGTRVLIGTRTAGHPTLHLFSNTFFIQSFKRITEPVHSIAMAPDATFAAIATMTSDETGDNHRIHIVDLVAAKTIWQTSIDDVPTAMEMGNNATTLAIGTEDGKVHVFDPLGPSGGAPIATHHVGPVITDIAITLDGQAIAASADDGTMLFLHPDHDKPLWRYKAEGSIAALAMADDGEVLVIGSHEGETGRIVYTEADHRLGVVSPKEPRLVPGRTNTIQIAVGNPGNRVEEVIPRWDSLPPGWTGERRPVTLTPGAETTLDIDVKVPAGQAADRYELGLVLESAHTETPAPLTVRVPEVKQGNAEIIWSLPLAVPGGAPAAFLLELENAGNVPNGLTLGYARLPAGWKAVYDDTVSNHLQPGEARQVLLKVYAPAKAGVGQDITFDAIIAWSSGEEQLSLTLTPVKSASYVAALQEAEPTADDPNRHLISDRLNESLSADVTGNGANIRPSVEKDTPATGAGIMLAAIGALLAVGRRANNRRRR